MGHPRPLLDKWTCINMAGKRYRLPAWLNCYGTVNPSYGAGAATIDMVSCIVPSTPAVPITCTVTVID